MPTTIVKTIGTGGDYTTLQAWEDACPANLVSVDQIWQGQVKNEHFTSSSTILTISGTTVDAAHYVELTTQAGASFVDNPTQRGRFDSLLGASITMTGTWAVGVQVTQPYTRISKLQFATTATGAAASAAMNVSGASTTDVDINQCIFESKSQSSSLGTVSISNAGTVMRNSIVIQRYNNAAAIIANLTAGASAYNTVFASTGATQLTTGVTSNAGSATLKNIYIGNAATPVGSGTTFTKTTCFSNASATGFTVAAFSTATFKNVTDGTHDFLLAAGSSLIDAGTNDSTYAANDLYGVIRPQGSTTDVGAAEAVSSAQLSVNLSATATVTASLTSSISLAAAAVAVAVATAVFPTDGMAATSTATVTATGNLTSAGLITDPLINNTDTGALANQAVSYSWYPGGRIGSLSGITPTEGTGTTASDGTFSPSISNVSGVLLVCVRNAGATTDYVFYQAY